MLQAPKSPPSNPAELRNAAEGLVELAKTQALEIEKLKHQLAGHRCHRFADHPVNRVEDFLKIFSEQGGEGIRDDRL